MGLMCRLLAQFGAFLKVYRSDMLSHRYLDGHLRQLTREGFRYGAKLKCSLCVVVGVI